MPMKVDPSVMNILFSDLITKVEIRDKACRVFTNAVTFCPVIFLF